LLRVAPLSTWLAGFLAESFIPRFLWVLFLLVSTSQQFFYYHHLPLLVSQRSLSGVKSETMDRGSDVMKSHLGGAAKMEIRQTRRGFCQEIMGCEAKTEFKYVRQRGRERKKQ